ncbi:MAG: hypothetical protein ACUVUD_01445 [bacterium]
MNIILAILLFSLPPSVQHPNLSSGRAALLSAIVPGAGQLFYGARNRGEVMLWADGVMWLSWGGFSWYKTSKEHDAKLIARRFADADISINDPAYYRVLERYDNSEEFNEDVRRIARELYPDDPDAQRRYYENHGYFGNSAWRWGSDSLRIYSYYQTRKMARTAAITASFLTAGLVLNRIISMFDCLFFLPQPWCANRVEFKPVPNYQGIALYWRF